MFCMYIRNTIFIIYIRRGGADEDDDEQYQLQEVVICNHSEDAAFRLNERYMDNLRETDVWLRLSVEIVFNCYSIIFENDFKSKDQQRLKYFAWLLLVSSCVAKCVIFICRQKYSFYFWFGNNKIQAKVFIQHCFLFIPSHYTKFKIPKCWKWKIRLVRHHRRHKQKSNPLAHWRSKNFVEPVRSLACGNQQWWSIAFSLSFHPWSDKPMNI